MTTNAWTTIATGEAEKPYGHVPGHTFHDVLVRVDQRGTRYRASASERWGSCQGRDELHGEVTASAHADDPAEALRLLEPRAREVIDASAYTYLIEALCACEDALEEHDVTD